MEGVIYPGARDAESKQDNELPQRVRYSTKLLPSSQAWEAKRSGVT